MTPLARKITNELTLPVKQRTFDDPATLMRQMDDVHCFECTAVDGLIQQLAQQMMDDPKQVGRLAFLPADKTWLEVSCDGERFGTLLRQVRGPDGQPHSACIDTAIWGKSGFRSVPFGVLELMGSLVGGEVPSVVGPQAGWSSVQTKASQFTYYLYAAIALINSPRVVGRLQHMPHRSLERKLVAKRGLLGKFPLHAWTEIKLEVSDPKDASGEGSNEAHYTGERALHFCRAHIRIRLGRLEIVRGHWRGDASLGIRQSRYKLTAKTGEKLAPANAEENAA